MLNVDVWEVEFEPGDVMGWTVDYFKSRICLDGVLKGIGYICNKNGKVVSGYNGNNGVEVRVSKERGKILFKINNSDLGTPIDTMAGIIMVEFSVTHMILGSRIEQMIRLFLGRLSWRKGDAIREKTIYLIL